MTRRRTSLDEKRKQNREAVRRYRAKNREAIRQRRLAAYERNRLVILARIKMKRERDPATFRQRDNRLRAENLERRQQQEREAKQIRRKRLRAQVIEILGGCCARCGFSDARALQVDHVNGDGSVDRKKFRGQDTLYKHIIRRGAQGRYQILCANCNWIKRDEDGEYLHRKRRKQAA